MLMRDEDIVALITSSDVVAPHQDLSDPYAKSSLIQPSSLDLRIGAIYLPEVEVGQPGSIGHPKEDYALKPGQTAVVETQERLKMPDYVAAFGFPPHHVSSQGLLMTNPGHVDPGYQGSLTFTVINMGRNEYRLTKNDGIVTLLLFRLDHGAKKGWIAREHHPVSGATDATLSQLSKDFLQIGQRAKEIADDVVSKATYRATVFGIGVPIIVAILTVLGSVWVANRAAQDKITDLGKQVAVVQEDLKVKDLEQQIAKLTERLDALKTTPAGASPSPSR